MSKDNEKIVYATNGMGTWTSGLESDLIKRNLEVICEFNDPKWAEKVSDRVGVVIVAQDSTYSNDTSNSLG